MQTTRPILKMTFRPGRPEDAPSCGRIAYEGFKAIADEHNFPPDFPTLEYAVEVLSLVLSLPHVHTVVAEADGQIVGSNFLWEDQGIGGIGPITVDPACQNGSVGRQMMEHVLQIAQAKGLLGVRLVQAGYHRRSLALYTKLGFDVREPLAVLQGACEVQLPGYAVRSAQEQDLHACNLLCRGIHGHERAGELGAAFSQGSANVVEYGGRIVGYSTGIGFFAHAVAENNTGLKALIGAAGEVSGPGLLLPMRNGELFRWCLERGMRVVYTATLMSIGLYNEPSGVFLPSILY
ncbi:MAG: GNAT family N-acetyltransferase [Gemmatimonadaceae bacterium]|nr:GNAT family N-acetyltransferase [Gloeobacterales cyanobacterium ES-bin-141]